MFRGRTLWVLPLLVLGVVSQQSYPALSESALRYILEGLQYNTQEPREVQRTLPEYDFIIVGAGTAGCVLANRLTEVAKWKVLLIEAGDSENFLMDIPVLANYLQFTNANWKYKSMPNNRSCLGKVMGGSSVLNYMIMTRGNRRDYDHWADLGNTGWSFDDILPYFKKAENMAIDKYASDSEYHNKGGYQTVSFAPFHTPVATAFVEAGKELGFNEIDYNGPTQTGVSYLQTSTRNGTRCSTNRAYLHPIRFRKNLHIRKQSQVTKILIEPKTKRAYGIEYVRNNRRYIVRARREVILSSGAIGSPHLLMLSGVGPKDNLAENKINTIQDLPVGFNLQDHNALGCLTFLINDSVTINFDRIVDDPNTLDEFTRYHKGMATIPGGTEALAFIDLSDPMNKDGYPDLELLFIGATLMAERTLQMNFGITNEVYNSVFNIPKGEDGYMIFPMILRPRSRGRIYLQSRDPFVKPIIDMGYFTDPKDLDIVVKGVEWSIKLANTMSLQKFNASIVTNKVPGCAHLKFNTPAYWRCYAKHITLTIYHQSGTCKMGPDNDTSAVVDPRLRVRGIRGLRVVDASIIPVIPAAHTNFPVIMIAEKASDMIKMDNL